MKAVEYRRVKNDLRDATDLADLLRMGRLPEAWIAPPATRELRELVRHRAKLVGLRSHCKAEVHAVLAKCGVQVLMVDRFGVAGTELLDGLDLPAPYAARISSLRRLLEGIDFEIEVFTPCWIPLYRGLTRRPQRRHVQGQGTRVLLLRLQTGGPHVGCGLVVRQTRSHTGTSCPAR